MLIKEYRIPLPITVEEFQVAQLWSVAEASKNETGGGEGIEVLNNEPYEDENGKGQYTKKIYHFASRVPKAIKMFAPAGSLDFQEEAWNAYPYCRTVITNPDYMKDGFEVSIETWHKPGLGELENVHNLKGNELRKRDVVHIDIVKDPISSSDYKEEFDPKKFKGCIGGRGALTDDWLCKLRAQVASSGGSAQQNGDCAAAPPNMCAYKLVRCNFKWLGLQNITEKFIQNQERRLFTNFHRQVYGWMHNWYGLTMDDIRRIEDQTKDELNEMRGKGSRRGMKADDM